MLKFLQRWRAGREQARIERQRFESFVAAFANDSEMDSPSASKHPEAAKYRFAWKRAVVLEGIYAERSDEAQVVLYKRVQERLASVEAWFPCSPRLAKRYEKLAHAALASKRVPSREFFEIEVVHAIESVQRIVGRAPERP